MGVYDDIKIAILHGNVDECIRLVEEAIALKYPLEKILENGLIEGIDLLTKKFESQEIMIPELLMSIRAFRAGTFTLDSYISKKKKKCKGEMTIVLGVVSGDLHDIGKDIIRILVSTLNVRVVDLGVDVSKETFVTIIKKEKPEILMMSSLLTNTIMEMKEVIDELKKQKLRDDLVIFIGGEPVTEEFRTYIGADYYIRDALELRRFLKDNMKKFKNKGVEKNTKKM